MQYMTGPEDLATIERRPGSPHPKLLPLHVHALVVVVAVVGSGPPAMPSRSSTAASIIVVVVTSSIRPLVVVVVVRIEIRCIGVLNLGIQIDYALPSSIIVVVSRWYSQRPRPPCEFVEVEDAVVVLDLRTTAAAAAAVDGMERGREGQVAVCGVMIRRRVVL
jgi:hypothetical protein